MVLRRALLLAFLLTWSASLAAQVADRDRVAAAAPAELIEIVKRHVWPDTDLPTRLAAQERLASLGRSAPESVVPLLARALAAPRDYGKTATHQRIALIETLRDIGPAAEAAVPVLAEILEDAEEPNDWVKMAASMALGRIGGPAAEDALAESAETDAESLAASEDDAELARNARHSAFLIRQELRRPRPYDPSITAGLPNLRAAGAAAADALPTLLRAYRDPRIASSTRAELAQTIRALGVADPERAAAAAPLPGEVDLLGDLLADVASDDDFIASLAMSELGKIGPSQPALAALIAALDQGRSAGAAANALGAYGAEATPAVPHLVPYLADERIGANAIQAVGKIGAAEPGAVAELRRIARSAREPHRGMAAKTLGLLAVRAALPDLQSALTDHRKYTRILAAGAIGRFGPEAAPAVQDLGLLLGESDLDVRRAAIEALGRIGPIARPAAALIARDLDSSDRRLREAAEQALAKIGGPAAESAVEAGAEADLARDQVAAAGLMAGGNFEALSRYLRGLSEPRRLALAEVLADHEDPQAAFLGAATVAELDPSDAAIAKLVALILADEKGPDRLMAFSWALLHGGDEARAQAVLTRLGAELQSQLVTAPEEVRTRFGLVTPPAEPSQN